MRRTHLRRPVVALTLLAVTLLTSATQAADRYYDTNGVTPGLQAGPATWDTASTATWSTADTGTGLVSWADSDTAFFQTGGANTLTISGDVLATGLVQGTAGTTTSISGGSSLTIGSGGIANNAAGADGALTITTDVYLASSQSWLTQNTAGVAINVSDVAGTASTGNTQTLTFNVSSTAAGSIAGVLSDGGNGGMVALTKAGTGTLVLASDNDYSGGTTLGNNSGTLQINHAGALGTGAIAHSGGTLSNGTGSAVTLDNVYHVNATAQFGGSDWILTNLTLGTAAGANRTINVNGGTSVTLSTSLASTTNTLVKSGSGTLVLSAANSQAGTTLSAGTLVINHADALGGGTHLVVGGNGTFDNTSGSTLTIDKGLQLSGGSPTYTGSYGMTFTGGLLITGANRTLTVAGSTVTINGALSDNAEGRSFTKSGAGTLVLTQASTHAGGTNAAGGVLQLNHAGALGPGNVTLGGGTIFNNSGGTITHNVPVLMSGVSGLSGSGFVFGKLTNSGGNRTLTADADVSFTALDLVEPTSGSNRTTFITGGGVVTISGAVANGGNGSATAANFTYQGSGTLNLQGANTFGGAFLIQNGTVNLSGSHGGVGLVTVHTNGRLNLTGSVASNLTVGAGGGTPSSGTLVMTPAASIAGTLTLTRGVFANSSAAPLTVNNTLGTFTSLMTFGGAEYGSNGDIVFANAFPAANAFTVTVNNRTTLAVQMNPSGGATFGVAGTGTLVFLGSVGTDAAKVQTIGAGATLQLGNGGTEGSLANGPIVIDGEALIYNKSSDMTLANAISGSGQLIKRGSGVLTLTGSNKTYTGGTSVEAGELIAASLGDGSVSVTAGVLELTAATAISDSAGLSVAEGAVVRLNFGSGVESVGALTLGATSFAEGTEFNAGNGYQGFGAYFTGSDAASSLTVVPEPAAAGVLGLLALAMRRRRRVR